MSSNSTTSYDLSTQILWRQLGEEGVILHSDSSVYFRTNRVGSLIFSAIAEDKAITSTKLAEIIDLIVAEYDAPKETVAADAHSFVSSLEESNIIARVLQ